MRISSHGQMVVVTEATPAAMQIAIATLTAKIAAAAGRKRAA